MVATNGAPQQVQMLKMDEIYSDPDFNVRGEIRPTSVIDLARDIKAMGLLQPIAVQPITTEMRKESGIPSDYKYRIIAGHRRHMAFIVNEEDYIPAIVHKGVSDIDALTMNLNENLIRKELNILQEAQALRRFKDKGVTIEETAKRINKSKGWIHIRFALLDLPEIIQKEAASGFLNQEHIRQLNTYGTREAKIEAVKKIKEAKIRGEKAPVIKKKKSKPTKAKKRDPSEIGDMIGHILDTVGPCLATRALAWANGNITDIDLHVDIQEYAKERGIDYKLPEEVAHFVGHE